MRRAYDYLVNETIATFVLSHLPDAHGWEGGTYRMASLDGDDGQTYRIEVDIPTSAQGCWASFEVAIPIYGPDPMPLFFSAARSKKDGSEDITYVCEVLNDKWRETD